MPLCVCGRHKRGPGGDASHRDQREVLQLIKALTLQGTRNVIFLLTKHHPLVKFSCWKCLAFLKTWSCCVIALSARGYTGAKLGLCKSFKKLWLITKRCLLKGRFVFKSVRQQWETVSSESNFLCFVCPTVQNLKVSSLSSQKGWKQQVFHLLESSVVLQPFVSATLINSCFRSRHSIQSNKHPI